MLTQKEVLEISDRAIGHQALIEKYSYYINHCFDPQVRNLIQQHLNILQRHHHILMNFLINNQEFNKRQTNTRVMLYE